jgi:hypothetical protein
MGKLAHLAVLFVGRHFDREVIILCVRWYRFKLSQRNLVEMMVERGLSLAHTTIMRCIQHYTPEFEKRGLRYALAVGQSWRVDEARRSRSSQARQGSSTALAAQVAEEPEARARVDRH